MNCAVSCSKMWINLTAVIDIQLDLKAASPAEFEAFYK